MCVLHEVLHVLRVMCHALHDMVYHYIDSLHDLVVVVLTLYVMSNTMPRCITQHGVVIPCIPLYVRGNDGHVVRTDRCLPLLITRGSTLVMTFGPWIHEVTTCLITMLIM